MHDTLANPDKCMTVGARVIAQPSHKESRQKVKELKWNKQGIGIYPIGLYFILCGTEQPDS